MKILLLTNLYPPQLVGGYEVLAYQAAERLRADGHELYVLTSNEVIRPELLNTPEGTHIHRDLRMVEVTLTDNSADYQFQAHVWQRFNNVVLHNAIEEFNPDVAYVWSTEGIGSFGLIQTLDRHGVGVIWHLQDTVPYKAIAAAAAQSELVKNYFAALQTLKVICVSRTLASEVTQYGLQLAHPITFVRNWVLPQKVQRSEYWDGVRPLRILIAGQLAPHKGIDFSFEALNKIKDRNFTLSLVGNRTDHVDSALEVASKNGWSEKVSYLGPKTMAEMSDIYLGHDILLFPTWSRDPMPIVALESAIHGCVPMLSEHCGTAEWLKDGVDALLIKRDAGAIADSLTSLFENPTHLESIARYGVTHMESNFSLEEPIAEISGLLQSIPRYPARDFYSYMRDLERQLFARNEVAAQSKVKRVLRRALSGTKLKFVIWIDGLPWVRGMDSLRESNRRNFPK